MFGGKTLGQCARFRASGQHLDAMEVRVLFRQHAPVMLLNCLGLGCWCSARHVCLWKHLRLMGVQNCMSYRDADPARGEPAL